MKAIKITRQEFDIRTVCEAARWLFRKRSGCHERCLGLHTPTCADRAIVLSAQRLGRENAGSSSRAMAKVVYDLAVVGELAWRGLTDDPAALTRFVSERMR